MFLSIAGVPVPYFPHYVIKSTISEKKLKQNVFFEFSTILTETFRIISRIEGDIMKEHKSSCQLPVIHVRF